MKYDMRLWAVMVPLSVGVRRTPQLTRIWPESIRCVPFTAAALAAR